MTAKFGWCLDGLHEKSRPGFDRLSHTTECPGLAAGQAATLACSCECHATPTHNEVTA